MTTHQLKCWPEYFALIKEDIKTFDLRIDDRDPKFSIGDHIHLEEYSPSLKQYTGRVLRKKIGYIARGKSFESFGLKEGHCVLGLCSVE